MKSIFSKIRDLKRIDFTILISVLVLSMYGVMNISNANIFGFARRQLLFVTISFIVLAMILFIDYSNIKPFIPIIYYLNIVLLVFTKVFSEEINGASGWIQLGGVTLQPSEFMKISLVLMLAKTIDENDGAVNDRKTIIRLLCYIAAPLLAIVVQPDMGMTLVCCIMSLGVLFVAGLNIKFFLGGILFGVIGMLIIWDTNLLPSYWKSRIISFIDPGVDSLGSGLQVLQSKIGVGSGGFLGKHSMIFSNNENGYVSQFVPEPQNDFIFSVIGEYWGFVGAVFLLVLFAVVVFRIIRIARNSKDTFGELFCVGMIFYILYSVFQNIGMTIGLLPVTGINLPFISYGGSSMLSNMIGIALILNINMRKDPIVFNA